MPDLLRPAYLPAVKPGDLPEVALAMARSGLALMLYGSPGTGKTALIQGLGEDPRLLAWSSQEHGRPIDQLPVVTLSAPELNVEDLLGVPIVEDRVPAPPIGATQILKVTRWATPAALDPWKPFLLFIDEPNRCDPSVRNALFQLITGRTTSGGFCLPKGSFVCMAGNHLEDRAGVRALDTAFSNRCGHFELVVDPEAWLDWAAGQEGFSPMVRAFIARYPSQLCRFDPASPCPQQPTPRTWAGLGQALPSAPESLSEAILHGLVGVEAAQLFTSVQRHAEAIPTVEALMGDPAGIPVPAEGDLDRAWILATVLGDHLVAPSPGDPDPQAPLGYAVGHVLARLAEAGFEDVVVFSLQRAWRRILPRNRTTPAPGTGQRFFRAVEALAERPAFQAFLALAQEEGAA